MLDRELDLVFQGGLLDDGLWQANASGVPDANEARFHRDHNVIT
jgi:hypothetical protein